MISDNGSFNGGGSFKRSTYYLWGWQESGQTHFVYFLITDKNGTLEYKVDINDNPLIYANWIGSGRYDVIAKVDIYYNGVLYRANEKVIASTQSGEIMVIEK